MFFGNRCTRGCRFCAVDKRAPLPTDSTEFPKVEKIASKLKLSHVILAAVTRDDFSNSGADHIQKICEVSKKVMKT